MKFQRAYLESLGAKFILERPFRAVTRDMCLTGEIPRKTTFEKGDSDLCAERDGRLIPGFVCRRQLAGGRLLRGLVLILGCAHAGLVNILEYVLEKTGRDGIYAVIGGTHLDFSSPAQVDKTVAALTRYRVERIGVSHCTGLKAAARLHAEFGERFFNCNVGEVLEF